ncbi:TadE family protein [Parasporobacterium paucivorans]|uniref:TadE-like protein n=1 Tax=Parasporobacterium paucivorans DSM 15970 TaxID=1122934 RepID=A0A1M6JA19_9FIRM|nr:TadE family protein [Parasporobacterium paucivorans]SHJ43545.1 TadE-like protein [Parasporobacterium paucivorans DSM 15970]
MKRMWLSGSYTIEAALVLPTVLLIVSALLYFGFFLHDRLGIQASLYTYALNLSMNPDTSEWNEGFYLTDAVAEKPEVSRNRVKIRLHYGKNPFGGTMEIEIKDLDNSDFLRKSRALKGGR